jgi:hypothetical protein
MTPFLVGIFGEPKIVDGAATVIIEVTKMLGPGALRVGDERRGFNFPGSLHSELLGLNTASSFK